MSLRAKYVLYYIISLIAPALILIAGAALIYSTNVADNSLSVASLCLICFLLFLVGGFLVNFWYSKTLGVPMMWRICSSIFSTLGFFYLLGYDKNLISATQIVQESIEFCIKYWKTLIRYSLLFLIPIIIFSTLSMLTLLMRWNWYLSEAVISLILMFLITISMLATLWFSICLAQVIKNLLNNEQIPTYNQLLRDNSKLLWPTIYTSIFSGLIVIAGSLVIIPGIIFSVWYTFVFYTVIFEKQKGFDALRQSKALVVNRWFAILWRISAPAFIFSLLAGLINLSIQLLLVFAPANTVLLNITAILSALVSIIFVPLTTTATVLFYLHAKKTSTTASPKNTPVIV